MQKIVFSDIDGTLLSSNHKITPLTQQAIRTLEDKDIPFVIVSARGPSGIYPLMKDYNIECPIIAYSGAAILDEHKHVIYHTGMDKEVAREMIAYMEEENMDLAYGIYSVTQWIVKDRSDERVITEETNVQAQATEGTIDAIEGDEVCKILCMCNPEKILEIEAKMKAKFPEYSIAKSSDTLLELMPPNLNKANAIQRLASLWNVDMKDTIAFGDNYNDEEMLKMAGQGYLMANAPEPLKDMIPNHTRSNDEDGIYYALKELELI